MRRIVKKNKKGFSKVIFFILFFAIAVIGIFILALFNSAISFFSGEITPVIKDLGMVGDTNVSEIGTMAITPIEKIVNSLGWLTGVIYFIMLLGGLVLAYGYRNTHNRIYAVLFLVLSIVLIFVTIMISQAYEGFYNQDDPIGLGLQGMTLASFLIINAPIVVTIFAFIGAIIMMLPSEQEVYY